MEKAKEIFESFMELYSFDIDLRCSKCGDTFKSGVMANFKGSKESKLYCALCFKILTKTCNCGEKNE